MAKHDQRILKFLAQNSDRAPTITDMMTRLNISISEISASLSSLLAQGLIAKKTNNQGIECWFTAGGGAPASPESRQVSEPRISPSADPRFIGGMEKSAPPEPVSAAPSHFSAPSQHVTAVAEMPRPSAPSPMPSPMTQQPMTMSAPAKGGIGLFALLVAMAVSVVISTFLNRALVEKSVTRLSRGFVDSKSLNEALTTMSVNSKQSSALVRSLEDQVKKLNDQLTAMKAADSLKAAAVPKAEEKKPAAIEPATEEAAAPAPRKSRRRPR
jgi:DNA-binding transcriptional regulator GbsR (MarR family)